MAELRDEWKQLTAAGAVVYGVNPGSGLSHRQFVKKHGFPFPLLVDAGGRIARRYRSGFWRFVRRTVYVLSPRGRVVFSRRGSPPVAEILAAVKGCERP